MWILLEANLGLGSLRSKAAPTTSSVLERHKVILHHSLCYRTGFDANRGPWMGFVRVFLFFAAIGKYYHPRNPSIVGQAGKVFYPNRVFLRCNRVSQGKERLCHDRVGHNREISYRHRGFLGRDRVGHDIGPLPPTTKMDAHDRHVRTTRTRARPRSATGGVGCRSFLCRDIRFYVVTGNGHNKGFAVATEFGHGRGTLLRQGPRCAVTEVVATRPGHAAIVLWAPCCATIDEALRARQTRPGAHDRLGRAHGRPGCTHD